MAVPSPPGEVKMVSPIITFMLNTLTLKENTFVFANTRHNETGPQVAFANLGGTVIQNNIMKIINIHQICKKETYMHLTSFVWFC